jgi:serine/threonine protein phosphatase PrpC
MLFQLGDGLNAVVFSDDIVKCEIAEKDFTNETRAFGKSKKSDWLLKMMKKEDNTKYELILCTDGISDDIIDNTAVEFVHTVSSKTIGKNKNNLILKDILDSWPNKYSSDD